jgi:hypothetical protein
LTLKTPFFSQCATNLVANPLITVKESITLLSMVGCSDLFLKGVKNAN